MDIEIREEPMSALGEHARDSHRLRGKARPRRLACERRAGRLWYKNLEISLQQYAIIGILFA
jgi:hypothetical protein